VRAPTVLALACALGGCERVWGLGDLRPSGDGALDSSRPDGEPVGCPDTYDRILQTTASRYRVELQGQDWITAADDCADDKPGLTHLMVLSNAAEHDALVTIPATFLFSDVFIGGTDILTDTNTYRWVTNEVTNYAVPITAGGWEPGQPDSTGQCMELRALSGSLHDEGCANTADYICECDGRANIESVYR
jgi:hypothetical protein